MWLSFVCLLALAAGSTSGIAVKTVGYSVVVPVWEGGHSGSRLMKVIKGTPSRWSGYRKKLHELHYPQDDESYESDWRHQHRPHKHTRRTTTTTTATTTTTTAPTPPTKPTLSPAQNVRLQEGPANEAYVGPVPHPASLLCTFSPWLCGQPVDVQLVKLTDELGRPLVFLRATD